MADLAQYRAAERRLWAHYGVAPTEHVVRLAGLGASVRVLEVGQGQPVLFVHGSPNAGSKWAPLATKLAGFRCLLLDRPGCGLSEPVDYTNIDLRTFGADLIRETLDALHITQAALVASSLGGALALFFTQAHPERVTRLVQEGCPAFVEGFRVPPYNLASSVAAALFGWAPASRPAFRHMGHATSIDGGRFENEVLVWRDALMRHTDTARNENGLNRNIARRGRTYRYGDELLRQIRPPTLYLWGEDDPFGGPEIGRRCVAAQPNAALKSFSASGHLPWLDDAATHARLVGGFLRG